MGEVVKILGLPVNIHEAGVMSASRGLVGDTTFAVLPNVVPLHTFAATVLCQAVSVYLLEESRAGVTKYSLLDFPRETLEGADVQKFPDCSYTVRLGIFHVWLARARESCPSSSRPTKVRSHDFYP